MKASRSAVVNVVEAVVMCGCRKAFVVLSEDMVVTATRRFKPRKNERTTSVVLTIGKPNYAVRGFIKACKKAGEPFPVRKVQLRWYHRKAHLSDTPCWVSGSKGEKA